MKKFTILLLCVLFLTGCNSKTPKETDNTSNQEDSAGAVQTDNIQKETFAPDTKEQTQALSGETTIAKTVLVDQDGVKITVTGMNNSSFTGREIQLLIENDTEQNITVQARHVSVNGLMVEPILSSDVAIGKKVNDTLTFMSNGIEENNIEEIAAIELSFVIISSDTYEDIFSTDVITIETSAKDTYTQAYDDSGQVLYDENNIKIIFKEVYTDDSLFGPVIKLYIENNSETNIMVQSSDVSINGFMVDSIMSSEVTSGKKANAEITFLSSDLEANSITDITQAELIFRIFATETFNTIVDTNKITIQP